MLLLKVNLKSKITILNKIQLKTIICGKAREVLFLRHGVLARVNLEDDVVRVEAVDLAAGGLSSAQNLLDGSLECVGHGPRSHLTSDGDDLVERNATLVLD